MALTLDQKATASYKVFGLTLERAEHLLDHVTNVCGDVFVSFPKKYAIHRDDGTFVLSIGQILTEVLVQAQSQQEAAFILFTSHTGVDALLKHFDTVFEKEP